jgi:hypothetical protein
MIVRRKLSVEELLAKVAKRPVTVPGTPLAGGIEGPPGVDGATWHSGAGAPAAGLGVNGDLYLRTSNSEVYEKVAGAWVELVNLKGAKGDEGSPGGAGPTGPAGPTSGGLILVRAATAAALAANTATSTKVLEATANAALAAQDGIALAVGDRLLVKNETTAAHNGVYEVTSLGSGSAKWKLTRISSMDESSEVVPGMLVSVAEGTAAKRTIWQLTTTGAIVLGTTALTFSPQTPLKGSVTGAGAVAAGAGFSVEHLATGKYKITPTTALPTTGICQANFNTEGLTGFILGTNGTSSFVVQTYSSAAALADLPFSFRIEVI